MFYENPGKYIPTIRNIWVENLDVSNAGEFGVHIRAYKESPVENLKLINCTINGVKKEADIDNVKNIEFENVRMNGQIFKLPENLKE